ncbi:hypothetical protein [uncultured Jannaschia sp.]|uniref:hypothetical protein n=1 Tax=uncultured Jannaschia sp. TaxID=293347 RepID=UPI0026278FC4|nr:hypothetical protein [uncultured Jannaschia sp.]
MLEKNAKIQHSALKWLTEAAKKHQLPYQVVGGLAALAHGGFRPLHDIDLYMPFGDPRWTGFLDTVKGYVTWGPDSVVEGAWDLTYVKINYHGQKIEIGDCENLMIQDWQTGKWINQSIEFGSSVSRTILGCEIDVMPVDQLIAYKQLLGRDVDQQDVRELTSSRL